MAAMRSSRQFSATLEIIASSSAWCSLTPAVSDSVNSQSLRSAEEPAFDEPVNLFGTRFLGSARPGTRPEGRLHGLGIVAS